MGKKGSQDDVVVYENFEWAVYFIYYDINVEYFKLLDLFQIWLNN